MPKIRGSKEALEGKPPLPAGIFTFRLDGFKPKTSSKGTSVNLNPTLKVINHATLNDSRVFENLNSQATWVHQDFCHALGVELEGPDKTDLPGEFMGPQDKPEDWKYVGPLAGKTGQVELVTVPKKDKSGNVVAGTQTAVKRYICAIPGCTVKHSESLQGA